MKFYRVENDKHEGPYNNFSSPVSLMEYLDRHGHAVYSSEHENYMQGHPRPDSDYILAPIWGKMNYNKQQDYIFGFENIDLLFNWFCMKEEIDFMKEFNYHISIYETNDCYHGKWQSIANKETLVLIEEISF
jgi:hypothetical protein